MAQNCAVPPSTTVRILRWIAVVVMLGGAAGCGIAGTPHPVFATPASPGGPMTLAGWKLTLPVAGRKGDAATLDPAAVSPPWLVADGSGGFTLWAPVAGVTTPHSDHPRTELDSLSPFRAGVGRHVLTAEVTVAKLPKAEPDVILGQIHGADTISSVPFVMLHDDNGTIDVVVDETPEIQIGENIAVHDDERLVEAVNKAKWAGCAERLLFVRVTDVHVTICAVVENSPDQVRQVADTEDNVPDAMRLELFDHDLEDRSLADRHQWLREDRRIRSKARSAAAGKHDGPRRIQAVVGTVQIRAASGGSRQLTRTLVSQATGYCFVEVHRRLPAPADVCESRRGLGFEQARASGRQSTRSPMHCGVLTQADLRECPGEDLQVHSQRSSLDVQSIKPHLLGENPLDVVAHAVLGGQDFGLIRESKLREARDTGPHLQNLCICIGMQADERRILRPRPD